MDKVLGQISTPAIQFRKKNSGLKLFDKLPGEVVGSPHNAMTVMELSRLLKKRLKVTPSIDILLMVRHFSDWEKTGKADWLLILAMLPCMEQLSKWRKLPRLNLNF